jgi:hypothetical protein
MPFWMAAFSAGRPKASHPSARSTAWPSMSFRRTTTSPMM